jgi:hypothetical protein
MQFAPPSRHFAPLRSKYSPQHPVIQHLQFVFLKVRDQVPHPYRHTSQITLEICKRRKLHSRWDSYIQLAEQISVHLLHRPLNWLFNAGLPYLNDRERILYHGYTFSHKLKDQGSQRVKPGNTSADINLEPATGWHESNTSTLAWSQHHC